MAVIAGSEQSPKNTFPGSDITLTVRHPQLVKFLEGGYVSDDHFHLVERDSPTGEGMRRLVNYVAGVTLYPTEQKPVRPSVVQRLQQALATRVVHRDNPLIQRERKKRDIMAQLRGERALANIYITD